MVPFAAMIFGFHIVDGSSTAFTNRYVGVRESIRVSESASS